MFSVLTRTNIALASGTEGDWQTGSEIATKMLQ